MKELPTGGPVAKTCTPNAEGLGSLPGQGTRSHTPQVKILHATTKTRCSQTNKQIDIFKRKKEIKY